MRFETIADLLVDGTFATPEDLLRISVGLEHPQDLIEDLLQALQA